MPSRLARVAVAAAAFNLSVAAHSDVPELNIVFFDLNSSVLSSPAIDLLQSRVSRLKAALSHGDSSLLVVEGFGSIRKRRTQHQTLHTKSTSR